MPGNGRKSRYKVGKIESIKIWNKSQSFSSITALSFDVGTSSGCNKGMRLQSCLAFESGSYMVKELDEMKDVDVQAFLLL